MSRAFLSPLLVVCVSPLLFGVVGCGGKSTVELSGKLVLPPKTTIVETDSVSITFVPEAKGDKGATPQVNPDLSFSTKDVFVGKYKISVSITPYAGMKESEARQRYFEDYINKDFTLEDTKLTYEVTSDAKQSIVIDLVKKTVTKQ